MWDGTIAREENTMDRIAIIVASIVIATAIVVGASYGALWLQPLFAGLSAYQPALWTLIGVGILLPGYFMSRRTR
jgi:hypothetical protein